MGNFSQRKLDYQAMEYQICHFVEISTALGLSMRKIKIS